MPAPETLQPADAFAELGRIRFEETAAALVATAAGRGNPTATP